MRAESGSIFGGLLAVMTLAVLPLCGERSVDGGQVTVDGGRVTVDGGGGTVEAGRRGFRTRAMSGIEGEAGRAWAERNGLTPPLAFSHNLAAIVPPALHAQHPEFFPLVNGERLRPRDGAHNWNPDLRRADVAAWAAEAARRHFDAHPESESFSVGVNDGLIFGDSAETRDGGPSTRLLPSPVNRSPSTVRWFRSRPDLSNLVFGFTNRVARDVAQTHPGKYVGALAYYWCENAPDFPLEPNVIPFLTADRSQGYDEAFRAEELALQRRWADAGWKPETRNLKPETGSARVSGRQWTVDCGRWTGSDERGASDDGQMTGDGRRRTVGGGPGAVNGERDRQSSTVDRASLSRRIGLYDYLYGSGFLIPRIHTRLIADNLRQARRLGFTDYFAEVKPNWGLDGPMPWLVAQLLLDPEQSREVLLEEYYHGYFGDAAVSMRRFFERCEQQWMHQPGPAYWLKHYRNESQARLFPSAVCRELRGWLDEAARQARRASVQARVKFVSVAFGVTERFVAFCEARDTLNRAGLAHETLSSAGQGMSAHETHESHETLQAHRARYQAAREEFIAYTQALMAREPQALAPFQWEDYLRHEPPGDGGRGTVDSGRGTVDGRRWVGGPVDRRETGDGAGRAENLLRKGDLRGALVAPRRIGGLDYGVALPEGWLTTVEPAEGQSARIEDGVLRLERNKETFVYQWLPASKGGRYRATVEARGRVQPSATASLTLSWLDERQTPLGFKVHRLPEGEWSNWVTLEVAQDLPAAARWIGTGVRVQHQHEGDWLEVRAVRLERVR